MNEQPPPAAGDLERSPGPCRLVRRRALLAGLGATVTLTAIGGQAITVYRRSPGADTARPLPKAGSVPTVDRTLVVVELGGGNDGLSTVVPLSSRYQDLRPTTAVQDPIELDREIGLHPALATVADRYRRREVAIVEGLGIDKPDLSHFVSMRRWWDGTDRPDRTGWLGRYLDVSVGEDEVLAGISIGPGPSPATLGGSSFSVGISDAGGLASGFPWWVDDVRDFTGIWADFAPADVPLDRLDPVHRAIAAAARAQSRLQVGLDPLAKTLDRAKVDTSTLEGQLALAAALVASPLSPTVIYVHGNVDFDTHENQTERHTALMGQLDRGLARFFALVESAGAADRTLVMTTSEFGRRARDNDGGTDHGTAGAHLVIGPAVAGGRYGEPPNLARLDPDGNLVHTVDFRSLYATVLDGWLKAGQADLLGADYEVLPLWR